MHLLNELKNAYKHLEKENLIEKITKYFMSLFSRYHLYDGPVLVQIA